LGVPTRGDILLSCDSVLFRMLTESFSAVCVNSFVLVSGWYGIKSKWSRFAELIFQVTFTSISIYAVMRVLGLMQPINIEKWLEMLLIKHRGYWFVKAYFILYLFAPILNTFANNVGKSQLKNFLVAFFVIQLIYGFYHYGGWYAGGYSPLSFMGLYVLARYIRLYPNKYTQLNKYIDMTFYFAISILTAIVSLVFTYLFDKGGTVLFLYSCPFVILSSVFFFLFFTKLSFQSRIINWIAVSCFAVYLVHNSPFLFHPYYTEVIQHWFTTESSVLFLLKTTELIFIFFVFSILFDKLRFFLWNFIYRFYQSNII
jgi:hypothetical protein